MPVSLDLHVVIDAAQAKNGIRYGDYRWYRYVSLPRADCVPALTAGGAAAAGAGTTARCGLRAFVAGSRFG